MNAKSKLIKRVLSVMMAAVLVFGAIPFAGMGLANLASAAADCTHPNAEITYIEPWDMYRVECPDCEYAGWDEDGVLEDATTPVDPDECDHDFSDVVRDGDYLQATCPYCGAIAMWYDPQPEEPEEPVVEPCTNHVPAWDWAIDVEPTCTEPGKKHNYCGNLLSDGTKCGAYMEEIIPARGHCLDTTPVDQADATCEAAGYIVLGCKNCDYEEKYENAVIDCIGGEPVVTPATCTEEGSLVITCTMCGDELVNEVLPVVPHDYVEVARVETTCTEAGNIVYECTACGDTKTIALSEDAYAHAWGEWEVKTAPACEVEGVEVRVCARCEAEEERAIAALEHVDTGKGYTYKLPTCTEEGKYAVLCDVCGKFQRFEAIEALGHTAYEYTYKLPTCTEEGQLAKVCTVCGVSLGISGTIPANGHDYSGEWVVTVPSTCTEAGVETLYCAVCGEEIDNRPAPLAPHEESNWIVIKAPTCLEAGFQITVCVNCDLVMDVAILAAGHDAGAWVTTIPATCAAPGEMVQNCKLCDATLASKEIAALDHIPGAWVVTTEPNADDDGIMTQYCAICGAWMAEKAIAPHTCVEGNPEILVAPTCEAEGIRITSCTICEKTLSETAIAALGHTEGAWKITVEPTLTAAGEKTKSCTVCAKVLDTAEVAAHECKAGKTEITKDATCTVDGIKATTCVICEAVMTEEAIPATGHAAGAYVTVKAPTCTEAGEKVLACTVCNAAIGTEAIEALGHEAGAWVETKAADCSTAGEAVQHCTRCDAIVASKEIAAHAHVAGATVIVKEATCTVDGIKATTCVHCEAVIAEEAIPATGHAAGAFVETKAPTCNNAGEKTQYCTVCAQAIATEVIEPYGHSESGYVITIYADCENYGEAVTKCSTCAQIISTKVLEPIGHVAGPVHNCCEDQVCLTCEEVLVPADALSHVWSEWTTFKAESIFKDRIERRFCVKCYAAGINTDEYREVAYTAKCHQCWPHNEHAEDCGCTACDILNVIQGGFKNIDIVLWFTLTQNIVTELLFPWFL